MMEPSQTMQHQQHKAATGKDAEDVRVEAMINNITRVGITNEEVLNAYSSWAGTYEADVGLKNIGYRAPALSAAVLASVLGPDNAQARIIDIAAATGLVGLELQKMGFTNIDAVDASPQMLQVAKQKGIYKNLITALIGPDRLPIETDCYDAVIAAGCFVHGHVDASCFEELFRITKPEALSHGLGVLPNCLMGWGCIIRRVWRRSSGGHVVVVLNEKRLPFELFEATLQHHLDNGICKWVERRIVPDFFSHDRGMAYILQALPARPGKQ